MKNQTGSPAKSLYEKSVRLIAEIGAVVVSFFATGPLYSLSVNWVVGFAQKQYGHGWETLTEIFWFLVVSLSIYAFARATVATLITVGGFALWAKFF